MEKSNNCKIPATKVLSREDQDRRKDILRAIFVHKELWTKNGYPKATTIGKKWNVLLNHPILTDYLDNNEGNYLTFRGFFVFFQFCY